MSVASEAQKMWAQFLSVEGGCRAKRGVRGQRKAPPLVTEQHKPQTAFDRRAAARGKAKLG